MHNFVAEVTSRDDSLVLTLADRNQAADMGRRAGIEETAPKPVELRRYDGEVFVGVDGGEVCAVVEFLGDDGARFLHIGRALPQDTA